MSTSVTLNGSTNFALPAVGEDSWGTDVTNYLVAIASSCLAVKGGAVTLLADADFGASYGLKSAYYKSRGTVSTTGVLRLANDESVGWRNAANSANKLLKVNASNVLEFDSAPVLTLALGTANYMLRMNSGGTAYEWGTVANAHVDGSAAIAYSKLNLAGGIVNADVSGSAAIARSKIAAGTADHVAINDGSGNLSSEAALSAARGGTGVANNAAATTTRVGNYAKTETLTGVTGVTYPTTGTLATLGEAETFSGVKSFSAAPKLLAQTAARFYDSDSTNYVGLKAPASITANLDWTLPSADGSANQVLKTDGSGALGWVSQSLTDSIQTQSTAGPHAITDGVTVCLGTASSGTTVTYTLPAAASYSGRRIAFKQTGTGKLALSGTVDGLTTNLTINAQYGTCEIFSDGTSWLWLEPIHEQGTFTVASNFATSNGTRTDTVAVGGYTRTGNRVHITVNLAVTRGGTPPTGTFTITGLPYTSAATAGTRNAFCAYVDTGLTLPDKYTLTIWLDTNSSVLQMYRTPTDGANSSGIALTGTQVTATLSMWISGSYLI